MTLFSHILYRHLSVTEARVHDAALTLLEDATIPDEAEVLYWVLDAYQLATVRRNEAWWCDVLGPALAKVWAVPEVEHLPATPLSGR